MKTVISGFDPTHRLDIGVITIAQTNDKGDIEILYEKVYRPSERQQYQQDIGKIITLLKQPKQ